MIKPGDIVVANCVITDKDGDGNVYVHAVPGTFGVVSADDFTPEWPVINWLAPVGYGSCNTRRDTFDIYGGRVYQVVG